MGSSGETIMGPKRLLVGATVSVALVGTPACHAAIVTDLITFTAQFAPDNPEVPPDLTLTGSYTLTFDPAVDVANATAGLTVNGVVSTDYATILTGYTVQDDYPMPPYRNLFIGGLASGVAGVAGSTLDYEVEISEIDTATPTFQTAVIGRPDDYYLDIAVSGVATVAPVPEPATAAALALLPTLSLRRPRRQRGN
jgi:hypothetical protein